VVLNIPPLTAYKWQHDVRGAPHVNLGELEVRPVERAEEARHQALMQTHHYLGALPKIGETLWYVATYRAEWVALLTVSAAAWKCGVRDRWIGWDVHRQYARLKLIANNSRFLILPDWHRSNLGSKTLSLCQKRLPEDWRTRFGHPVVLIETFVDPQRFQGTVYRAANWVYLGQSLGYRRVRGGYSGTPLAPKKVFVTALQADARAILAQPFLPPGYNTGAPTMRLQADHMRSLPELFADIPDPRQAQGRRHRLAVVLAIAAGATLCGMRGTRAGRIHGREVRVGDDDLVAEGLETAGHPFAVGRGLRARRAPVRACPGPGAPPRG